MIHFLLWLITFGRYTHTHKPAETKPKLDKGVTISFTGTKDNKRVRTKGTIIARNDNILLVDMTFSGYKPANGSEYMEIKVDDESIVIL